MSDDSDILREKKSFVVDARAVVALGRDSIKDHTTAVLELVKNSYDADATRVDVDINTNCQTPGGGHIRIADNGKGMTEEQIDKYWLRIGFSAKRGDNKTASGRRKTGEKGIGRLSADRLGATLELRTKVEGSSPIGLLVDWRRFDIEGKELQDIEVETVRRSRIELPAHGTEACNSSGTELIIRNLRQNWTPLDVASLYDELSILTPPFGERSEFQIRLSTDVPSSPSGIVESPFMGIAELDLEVRFDGKETITYSASSRTGQEGPRGKLFEKGSFFWNMFLQNFTSDAPLFRPPSPFGPVTVRLMFIPRKQSLVSDTQFTLRIFRSFLDRHCGIRIYRDGIRVKPYGDPHDPQGDWLGLGERKTRDPAGAARKSFRVSHNQVIGMVSITRNDNADLSDSASREGLVKTEAYADLRAFVLGCVFLLESLYHKQFLQQQTQEKDHPSPTQSVVALENDLRSLQRELKSALPHLPERSVRTIERAREHVDLAIGQIRKSRTSVRELISQTVIYRGLATTGIAATVFGHEIQCAIDQCGLSLAAIKGALEVPALIKPIAAEELGKAKKYCERISAWGKYALARVSREKRTSKLIRVDELVTSVLLELESSLEGADIALDRRIAAVEGRIIAMDVEAVLVNLITNAYAACKLKPGKRLIRVSIREQEHANRQGFELAVSDTGPGVAPQYEERIWEPLFTTKVVNGRAVGTGLGLAIVKAIVDDNMGKRSLGRDDELGGARFCLWFPLG